MKVTEQLAALPTTPGIYIYKDAQGGILYVGKAKRLSARVRSYFRPLASLDAAKQQMVKLIKSIETISTDNETEALVLEANLIRKRQPPYNVVLRDDKYYLFIKITTNEEYPRVFPVRRVNRDGARYFGPYSSSQSVRSTLRLLRRLFPYKGEKDSPHDIIFPHPLFTSPTSKADDLSFSRRGASPYEGEAGRQRPDEVHEQYLQNIQNVIRFLSGQREEIMRTLRAGMEAAAQEGHYERAATFRDQLQAIERLEGTQKVFLPTKESFDAVSLARASTRSAANVFQVREGKLLGKQTFLLQ
ncbi:MAG: GIY-YIG nuclease family protein, partial [Patescibacteria group bacterium]